jgi:hypothetical protein
MDAIERAVPAPQIEIVIQRRARWQVFRNRPPLAAGAQDVHQPVDNLAQLDRALVAAALGRRNAGLDQSPFVVAQVTRIAQAAAVIACAVLGRRRRLP